jgi:hypothetical protein
MPEVFINGIMLKQFGLFDRCRTTTTQKKNHSYNQKFFHHSTPHSHIFLIGAKKQHPLAGFSINASGMLFLSLFLEEIHKKLTVSRRQIELKDGFLNKLELGLVRVLLQIHRNPFDGISNVISFRHDCRHDLNPLNE